MKHLIIPSFQEEHSYCQNGQSLEYVNEYIRPIIDIIGKQVFGKNELARFIQSIQAIYGEMVRNFFETCDDEIIFWDCIDELFWEVEEYIIKLHNKSHLHYQEALKIAAKYLTKEELIVIQEQYGFGVQKGDQLNISLFLEYYPDYSLERVIKIYGKFFFHLNQDMRTQHNS